ncbi:hypothetical protein WISP_24610 [Willisornis vidua]|uniref:Uncharacterized protein n=1 Tax=Willisornis vidua TaxID=1566151 RepID=A0ABQ9DMV5_9PASS|nr:hypothetical protein WISP_24610 [Willisornis vidua]
MGSVRKATAHLRLTLANDTKGSKKSSYTYMGTKKMGKDNVGLWQSVVDDLVAGGAGGNEVLGASSASQLSRKLSQAPELGDRVQGGEEVPVVGEDQEASLEMKASLQQEEVTEKFFLSVPLGTTAKFHGYECPQDTDILEDPGKQTKQQLPCINQSRDLKRLDPSKAPLDGFGAQTLPSWDHDEEKFLEDSADLLLLYEESWLETPNFKCVFKRIATN